MTDMILRPVRLLLAVLMLAAMPAVAIAQATPRPEVGEPIPFELPPTTTIELENGLTVSFIPWGMTPTVDILVSVRAGNIDDGPNTWIADITAAMMEEGAAGRSKQETARAFADMGGSLNRRVTATHTLFGTYVLAEHGPEAVSLLADAVRRPDFPASALSRVRTNMLRDVELIGTAPEGIAMSALVGHLYGEDHPYHRLLPSEAQLDSYSIADMRRFHRGHFGAQRTHVYVAGRFDHAVMEAAIRQHFADWPAGPEDVAGNAEPNSGPVVHLIDRPDSTQSTVMLVYPVGRIDDKSARAVEVMDSYVGGTLAWYNRDQGYSYSPNAYVRWTRGGGYWTYEDSVDSGSTARALMEIFNLIDWMKTSPMDVAGTQEWLSNLYVMETGSTQGMLERVIERDEHELPTDYIDTYMPRLMAVRSETVEAVAGSYLDHGNLILVVVGDMDRMERQIRAIPQLRDAHFIRE